MGAARHLLTDTVTLTHQAGKSSAGDPTYGAQVTIKARVEHRLQKFITAEGNHIQAEHRVTSEDEIKISDRVWLPGDDTTDVTESRRPLAVGRASTSDGYTLYEAAF